jgi:hypothetical protein
MFSTEARAKEFGKFIVAAPFLIFAMAVFYHLGVVVPQREARQTQDRETSRNESARRAQETPTKFDVEGMTSAQLLEKYGVKDGRTTIKGHAYVLIGTTLWRVDDAW